MALVLSETAYLWTRSTKHYEFVELVFNSPLSHCVWCMPVVTTCGASVVIGLRPETLQLPGYSQVRTPCQESVTTDDLFSTICVLQTTTIRLLNAEGRSDVCSDIEVWAWSWVLRQQFEWWWRPMKNWREGSLRSNADCLHVCGRLYVMKTEDYSRRASMLGCNNCAGLDTKCCESPWVFIRVNDGS